MSSQSILAVPEGIEWLELWEPVTDSGDTLVREIRRELSDQHVLSVAVARRTDCDEVLFATADASKPIAVVHLTWRGQAEPDPRWPYTTLYEG